MPPHPAPPPLPPGAAAFDRAPWLDLPAGRLDPCRGVPTMLSEAEQRLYWWLGARWVQDAGAVVDLGCFAGGSTARLAEGLRAGGRTAPVVAYDRFRIAPAHQRRFLAPAGLPPLPDDDALGLVARLLAPWGGRIRLVRAEVGAGLAWDGGPVEVLVIDLAKSAASADAVAAAFFPALVPGRSVVVQQDFLHQAQPWLPAQMQALSRHFLPVAHCPPASMAFLCVRAVDAAALAGARLADMDDAAIARRLAAARRRYAGWGLGRRIAAAQAGLARAPGARTAAALRAPRPGRRGARGALAGGVEG